MELDTVERRPLHRAGEALAVGGGAEHVALGRWARGEGVDEVERRLLAETLGELRGVLPAHRRPADVRDLVAIRLERSDDAAEQRQPAGALVLHRGVEEQLHAEADPEHRDAGLDPPGDQLVQADFVDAAHRLREGADARQDHAVRGLDARGIRRDLGLRPDLLQRLLDRAQVAHPVVEDGDARHSVSVPLVEGTPLSSGSIETATRSARENALNAASIMWCALDPERTQRCSVILELLETARKNSSVSSESKPAMVTSGRSASKAQKGRPETSIAHSPSASSIGTRAEP